MYSSGNTDVRNWVHPLNHPVYIHTYLTPYRPCMNYSCYQITL